MLSTILLAVTIVCNVSLSIPPAARCSLSTASSAILAPVIASAAISAVTTPPVLIVTTPLDTSKLSLERSYPFALVEANTLE